MHFLNGGHDQAEPRQAQNPWKS